MPTQILIRTGYLTGSPINVKILASFGHNMETHEKNRRIRSKFQFICRHIAALIKITQRCRANPQKGFG
jgi:hypothetical protein